ncbi:MAG: hypothetical protein Q7R64_02720 [bacterium]|nr:hypothetical protein [bacterium]
MKLTSGQKFLYTRITILILLAGAFASASVGLWGVPFWYGGFVLCLWGALGLLNYGQHSSLWLIHKKPWLFVLLYGALAGASFLTDTFGLNAHLWFYPLYQGIGLFWVWLVLYPFGGLAMLELLYFFAGYLDEPLHFKEYPQTRMHRFFDVFESLLFLLMIAVIVLGAVKADWGLALPNMVILSVLWMFSALVKLRFHIGHPGHFILVIVIATFFSVLSHELPNTLAREWIYLEQPFLNFLIFGVPSWVWIGWFWLNLMTLRLWIFLVLHPKVR